MAFFGICPGLAGDDQQRPETARSNMEIRQLLGDLLRIADQINPRLYQHIDRPAIVWNIKTVAVLQICQKAALSLYRDLISNGLSQILDRFLACIRNVNQP